MTVEPRHILGQRETGYTTPPSKGFQYELTCGHWSGERLCSWDYKDLYYCTDPECGGKYRKRAVA